MGETDGEVAAGGGVEGADDDGMDEVVGGDEGLRVGGEADAEAVAGDDAGGGGQVDEGAAGGEVAGAAGEVAATGTGLELDGALAGSARVGAAVGEHHRLLSTVRLVEVSAKTGQGAQGR